MRACVIMGVLVLAAAGCAAEGTEGETISGESTTVFGAEVRTVALRDPAGTIADAGIEMPISVARNAAGETERTNFVLHFPAEVKQAIKLDHIYLNYEPQGHSALGVYDVPHFDIHFSFLDVPTREAITCPEADVPAERLPEGYVVGGLQEEPHGTCVPAVGVHAVDTNSPELHGAPFERTLSLVYHDGILVAIEVMATLDVLMRAEAFTLAVGRPADLTGLPQWPTRFVAVVPGGDAYRMVLGGWHPVD